MKYEDEEIIKSMQQIKKWEKREKENVFCINGEDVRLEEQYIFDRQVRIKLPENFVDMPMHLAKYKYPSEMRPQVIKWNENVSVSIAFNLFDAPAEEEQLNEIAETFKNIISTMNPAVIMYDTRETMGRKKVVNFSFKSYALDDQVFNILFIAVIHHKLLHGVFNCAIGEKEEWLDIMEEIMKSVDVNEGVDTD